MTILTTVEQLEALYGPANPRSIQKELTTLNDAYRAMVEAAPFMVMATAGPGGLDCSPKGDAPGFVRVLDPSTLAIPDRVGNNRIDSLRNIIADPRIALIFMIPGVGETLRINGKARISTAPELLAGFAVEGKPPRTVVLVAIEAVYFHCSRALLRSHLWDPARHVDRATLPSPGAMLAAATGGGIDGPAYDRDLPARLSAALY